MLKRLWPLLPLLLGLLAFCRAWDGDFLLMDDDWLVSDNPAVLSPNRQDLKDIVNPFRGRERFGHEYLPLRDLSYTLDAAVSRATHVPLNRICHLTQTLLYGLDCLLAALLLARLTGSVRLALIASSLFALHPAHAEAVCWISSRKDLLALLFSLSSLLAWRAHWKAEGTRQLLWYGTGWLAYLAGMLCKSPVAVLPGLILVTDLFFPPRGERWKPVMILRLMPFFAAFLPFQTLHVTHAMHGLISTPLPGVTWLKTALTMSRVGVAYLWQLSVPLANRAVYRPEWSEGWGTGEVLCVLLLMSLGAAGVLLAWKSCRGTLGTTGARIGWGLACLAVTMAPASNLIYHSLVLRADRYLLLPSLGFCLIAAVGLEALWTSRRTAVLVLGAAFLLRDVRASSDWLSSVDSSLNSLRQDPRHDFPHGVMGKDAAGRRDWGCAERHYRKASLLLGQVPHPNPWSAADAAGDLSVILGERGRAAEALEVLDRALQGAPGHSRLLGLRGKAFLRAGRLDDAERDLEAACRRAPWQEPAWVDLGVLRDRQGRVEEAERNLRRAVDLEPRDTLAKAYLGTCRYKQGDLDGAQRLLEEALRASEGDFPWARLTVAMIHLDRARSWIGAREHRRLIEQLDREPERQDLRTLVAGLKISPEETRLAKKPASWARNEALQAAARVPGLPDADFLLGLVAKQEGDLEGAEALLKRAVSAKADPDWKACLAEFLRAKGLRAMMGRTRDSATARAAWSEALTLYPPGTDTSGLKGLLELAEKDLLKQRFEAAASAFAAKDYRAAREGFGRALEVAPDFFEAWLNLGLACARMSDWEAAERAFVRAAGLRPEDAQAGKLLKDARERRKP